MNHNYSAECGNVKLRPLIREDIEALRIWRNDKEKTKYLRQIDYITPEMQQAWFEDYLQDKSIITFAIEETHDLKRMVGSVALYDIKDGQAEIGKIQIGDDEAHGRGIGRSALTLATKIAFEELGVNKLYAEVNQNNFASYINFVRSGFTAVAVCPIMNGGAVIMFNLTAGGGYSNYITQLIIIFTSFKKVLLFNLNLGEVNV